MVDSTPSGGKSISVIKNRLLPTHPELVEKSFLHLIELGYVKQNQNSVDSYLLTGDALHSCTNHYRYSIFFSKFKPTLSKYSGKILLIVVAAGVTFLFAYCGRNSEKTTIQGLPSSSGHNLSSIKAIKTTHPTIVDTTAAVQKTANKITAETETVVTATPSINSGSIEKDGKIIETPRKL